MLRAIWGIRSDQVLRVAPKRRQKDGNTSQFQPSESAGSELATSHQTASRASTISLLLNSQSVTLRSNVLNSLGSRSAKKLGCVR